MKIEEAEIILEDLDTLVEIARKNISCTGTWLGLTHSAVALREALEKQIPKPPTYTVHEKYKTLGKNYYCQCGVMFVDFKRSGTNYCGNCGQRLRD